MSLPQAAFLRPGRSGLAVHTGWRGGEQLGCAALEFEQFARRHRVGARHDVDFDPELYFLRSVAQRARGEFVESPACYECHQKIDPLGFALESFDPIGAWRSHYEKIEINRRQVTRTVGAPIDTSGELPGGQSFDDVAGLKKILVDHVRKEIGPLATPDNIQFAPGLPKTRSGKIMRRILRKIAEDDYGALGDTSTLADPAVVDDLVANRQNRKA